MTVAKEDKERNDEKRIIGEGDEKCQKETKGGESRLETD